MKAIKLLSVFILTTTLLTSCVDPVDRGYYDGITLEQLLTSYDLWYIDYNSTTGNGDVPFLSKAFTISFINGNLYANNNLVGFSKNGVGNGYGDQIGYYDTYNGFLEVDHDLDGYIDLQVDQYSENEIGLRDTYTNTTYYLIGYNKNNFDYDAVFYDNIEYFLQEYEAWEKTYTSSEGTVNQFDNENFLQFTPENLTTFYSSEDQTGTDVAYINWDYVGSYEVFDVQGYENLKILTLDYGSYGNEEFELSVIDDGAVKLYHPASKTTYEFTGRENIIYKNAKENTLKDTGRKRFKVTRKVKQKSTTI